jgi:hypothetical protein
MTLKELDETIAYVKLQRDGCKAAAMHAFNPTVMKQSALCEQLYINHLRAKEQLKLLYAERRLLVKGQRRLTDDWGEEGKCWIEKSESCQFNGYKMSELSRDELLMVIGYQSELIFNPTGYVILSDS